MTTQATTDTFTATQAEVNEFRRLFLLLSPSKKAEILELLRKSISSTGMVAA